MLIFSLAFVSCSYFNVLTKDTWHSWCYWQILCQYHYLWQTLSHTNPPRKSILKIMIDSVWQFNRSDAFIWRPLASHSLWKWEYRTGQLDQVQYPQAGATLWKVTITRNMCSPSHFKKGISSMQSFKIFLQWKSLMCKDLLIPLLIFTCIEPWPSLEKVRALW